MVTHFNPLTWSIDLTDHNYDELQDPFVRGRVLHEYIHYCQFLSSTLGRTLLGRLVQFTIEVGLSFHHGRNIPERFPQLDLWAALENGPIDPGVIPRLSADYLAIISEVQYVLNDAVVQFDRDYDHAWPFQHENYVTFELPTHEPPYIIHTHRDGHTFRLPMSERVLIENMARQIQRRFLLFHDRTDDRRYLANLDARRNDREEIRYICLNDYIHSILPPEEDRSKWTILTIQIALMCESPMHAMVYQLDKLRRMRDYDIDSYLSELRREEFIVQVYNRPPIHGIFDDLIHRYGTAIRMTENYAIWRLGASIADMINAIQRDPKMLCDSLLEWDTVLRWMDRFGCPPIRFLDLTVSNLRGREPEEPERSWQHYLNKISELLT